MTNMQNAANVETRHVFMAYRNWKCTKQVVKINRLSKFLSIIAKYVNLQNDNEYTGPSFQRTSLSLIGDSGGNILTLKQHSEWKSSCVAEVYIDDSFHFKMYYSLSISINRSHPDSVTMQIFKIQQILLVI